MFEETNKILNSKNIAGELDDDSLEEIGKDAFLGYEIDNDSRSEWEESQEEAIKLAAQVLEAKNDPFSGAANVKYPLLSIVAVQFAARAYSAIIPSNMIVKCKVVGRDPEGQKAAIAQRRATHMSWQLTEEMEEWEPDMDKALTIMPVTGGFFKKTYFSKNLGRNVSEYCGLKEVVVNQNSKSLITAPRVTHIIPLRPNQIKERFLSGIWKEFEFGQPAEEEGTDNRDDEAPHIFLEQHTYLDLDNDGYKEPYIVTFHRDLKKVVRIVARFDGEGVEVNQKGKVQYIKPVDYFTLFPFMPSVDGKFYPTGFGRLLEPINRTINTCINQVLDAASINNKGGGFLAKEVANAFGGGEIKFEPGEWKQINARADDIRKAILPKPEIKIASETFGLIELMIEGGQKLGSTAEMMTGEPPPANTPAASVYKLLEEGMKVFGSVYKRIFRSLKEEFKKVQRLNKLYLDKNKEFEFEGKFFSISPEDYIDELSAIPVGDPSEVSDAQKVAKAQALMQMLGMGFNDEVIKRRYLEALNVPDIDELIPDEPPTPPPDPKTMVELQKLELERDQHELKMFMAQFDIAKTQADVILKLADAESKELGPQLEMYKAQMDSLNKKATEMMKLKEQRANASKQQGSTNKG